MVTSHTCVLAAQSAMPCLSRAFLILCASTHRTPPRDCVRRWPTAAARARQLRLARVLRVGVIGLGRLAGTVVKELTGFNMLERFTCADGPRSIDFELVWRPLIEWLNVETWPFPACGSWIHAPSA